MTLLTLCSAVWLDIKYYSDYQRRVSAIGFLDGTISVFVVNVMRLLFYLSGILYAYESLPQQYHIYFEINPLAIFVDAFRDVLMYQQWPDINLLLATLFLALVALLVSDRFLRSMDPFIPRILLQK